MDPKWYALSADEAVQRLDSNAATGLSHKAARSRYGKKRLSGERDFFFVPRRTLPSLLAPIVTDALFWTLLLTCGALAFFENTRLAAVGLCFLLVNLILSVAVSKLSATVAEGSALAFAPKVKVVREGKLLSTDYRCAVRGDIVLLSAGDVIPFDARILSSEGLVVSTLCGRDEAGQNRFVRTEKNADVLLPRDRDLPPEAQTNTVTAGSTVLSGSARVLVTETGSYTYIGALTGGLSLLKPEGKHSFVSETYRVTRMIGIILLALTVPLTAIAFFLGATNSIAVSFLTVLSLCATVFPGWIVPLLDLAAMRAIYRSAAENGALIRTATASETLADTEIAVLFGRPMITDGLPHIAAILSEGRVAVRKDLRSEACRLLTEKALLLAAARRELPSGGTDPFDPYDLYRKELLAYAAFVGADAEMLRIRYRALRYRAPSRKHSTEALSYVETSDGEASERVLLCSPDDLLYVRCTHVRTAEGTAPLTLERRFEIKSHLRRFLSRGCEIRSYAEKEPGGDVVFLGFIAYAERIPTATRDALSSLRNAGVRTLLVLDGESSEDRFYATASGCAENGTIAVASAFHRNGRQITDGFGTYSAYLGFPAEEIATLLRTLRENGICTCGVAVDRKDVSLLALTSVKAVCGEARAVTRRTDAKELKEMPIDGVRHGAETSGQMKLGADALVRRASEQGGGLSALADAIALGKRIERNRTVFLAYLTASFGLRAGWLIPALFGLADLRTAIPLLFVGLVTDFLAGTVIASTDTPTDPHREGTLREAGAAGRTELWHVLAGCGTGLLLSALPLLFPLIGLDGSPEAVAAFRGLALPVAALFFLLRIRSRTTGVRFDRPMILLSALLSALLVAALVIPSLGALLGIPIFPGLSVLFLPFAALLPCIVPMGKR